MQICKQDNLNCKRNLLIFEIGTTLLFMYLCSYQLQLTMHVTSYFLLLLTFVTIVRGTENNESPLVQTQLGAIRGKYLRTEAGKQYAAFEGIPYAKPPTNKYRFREPRPIRSYKGTVEARFERICIQYNHYSRAVLGEEDCLYVNVYSSHLNSTNPLPVVIFIHGGAFMFGSAYSYAEKIIMDRDVVFVTIAYRLGPLGFLSTEDAVVPGNNGMKDQVLAMRWIHDNILYFGGDPNKITLTGMSAGAASVHMHYLSPLSTGLFTRGFSLSGTALAPWVLQENAREKAMKLASLLNCTTDDIRTMISCMNYIPAKNIVEKVPHFFGFMYNPFSPFGVVVEPAGTNDPFLPAHPYEMLKQGKIQDLPWFTSFVHSEGLYPGAEFWPDPKTLPEIESRWDELAPHLLDYNYTTDVSQQSQISSIVKERYLKGKPISRETFPELIQMMSDRLFATEAQHTAKLHASIANSSVYSYYFTYRGAHSKSETLSKSNENFGAAHGDDTVYVLSSEVNVSSTESDRNMTQVLLDLWMSYAYDGVPKLWNSTWDVVSKNMNDPFNFIEIRSPDLGLKQSKDFENVQFWLNLPFKENHHLFPNTRDEL